MKCIFFSLCFYKEGRVETISTQFANQDATENQAEGVQHSLGRARGRGTSIGRVISRGQKNFGPASGFGIWNGEGLSTMRHFYTPDGVFETTPMKGRSRYQAGGEKVTARSRISRTGAAAGVSHEAINGVRPNQRVRIEP